MGGKNSLHSEASRKKMSESSLGQKAWNKGLNKQDPRVKKYIKTGSDHYWYGKEGPRKGKKHTKETKEKISKALKGRSVSKITRLKKSIAMSKSDYIKKKRKKIKCLENNLIYNSMSEAAKKLDLQVSNICHVLKGNRKQTGGYSFVYMENK